MFVADFGRFCVQSNGQPDLVACLLQIESITEFASPVRKIFFPGILEYVTCVSRS